MQFPDLPLSKHHNLRRGISILGCLIGIGALGAMYYHLSALYPKTTDQANILYAGVDVLHGNWRLKDWLMAPPNYWTSDIALSALLSGLWAAFGQSPVSPTVLILQPALTWTAIVVLSIFVACSRV